MQPGSGHHRLVVRSAFSSKGDHAHVTQGNLGWLQEPDIAGDKGFFRYVVE
jgi:hypothetical protein